MTQKVKITLVIFGAVGLSTLAIQASDVFRGIEGSLSGLVIESEGGCGPNAILIMYGDHSVCMDTYEASANETCTFAEPQNELETSRNMSAQGCLPESKPEARPWRFVSLTEAQQLCARAGKRLPNNDEWYKAANGMTEIEMCAINTRGSSPNDTGVNSCVTPSGVHDMVGNVWEWVDGEVNEGSYNNRDLPPSGYVTLVDISGVVVETDDEPASEYGEDYALTNKEGLRGMMRGGHYNSVTDAGIFALNASVPLNFRATGVGFRCLKDI